MDVMGNSWDCVVIYVVVMGFDGGNGGRFHGEVVFFFCG